MPSPSHARHDSRRGCARSGSFRFIAPPGAGCCPARRPRRANRTTSRTLGGPSRRSCLVESIGCQTRWRPPTMRASKNPAARAAISTATAAPRAFFPGAPCSRKSCERLAQDRHLLHRRDVIPEGEAQPVVTARDAPPLLEVFAEVLGAVVRDDGVGDVAELVSLRRERCPRSMLRRRPRARSRDRRDRRGRPRARPSSVARAPRDDGAPRGDEPCGRPSCLRSLSGTGRAPTMPTRGSSFSLRTIFSTTSGATTRPRWS